MQFKQFTLDKFQEQAITAIEKNDSVVVSAPTGSGKTLIADYIIDKYKEKDLRIIYTAPIKALSNQKYRDFSKMYGEEHVGLMTGDVVINPTARVVIMTTEIYRNMVVSNDQEQLQDVAYVIFDEIHYINDRERGYVWEESIIYSAAHIRFLCLSATIPNAQEFSSWIQAIKKHTVDTVVATKRNVPLHHQFFDYELGITTLEKIKRAKETPNYHQIVRSKKRSSWKKVPEANHIDLIKQLGPEKLPCFFFSFSRKDCQRKAQELARSGLFKKDNKVMSYVQKKLADAPADINKLRSTKMIKEALQRNIGFHHAGLLPVIKEIVEDLFAQGLIKVLYTTETFAVGINMPAKTVCFASLRKYDGQNFRQLNTKEYFQIAGRAGRRGIDKVGYVVSMIYRPKFNYRQVKELTTKDIEPIQSQFRLSINTVLNLIGRHTPEEIEKILRLSFFSYQKFGDEYENVPTKMLLSRYNSIVRKLKKYEYIVEEELTEKGIFSSHIYADEISLGELFATDVHTSLDEYQLLLALGALVYEPREKDQFKQKFGNEALRKLKQVLRKNEWLARERKLLALDVMTTLIHPVYNGKTFFDVMKFTNLVEGDLIRFYGQVMDRIGQIKKATTNQALILKMRNCQGIIQKALEGIYLV